MAADDAPNTESFAGEAVYQTVKPGGDVGSLRVVYMPVRGEFAAQPFVVMVGLPENFIGEDMRDFQMIVILSVFALLALTAFGAYLLAERAIRPIEKITSAVETITARNLKERLPEPAARDQIGRLVAVFNQMLSRINAAFRAQRRFTDRAAHELRTPLTILKGENQAALNRRRTTEEYEAPKCRAVVCSLTRWSNRSLKIRVRLPRKTKSSLR